MPEMAREITRRWISLVPSKMVKILRLPRSRPWHGF
ncbi:hypothetical protein BJ998_003973 [Kutzneria kofuensis]|uniref:Uncharacterized protein n=1 Tax=Kutzneria kofuensis TaxID=103725 RepID=A0A7W9NGR7_9PSEU|nr:hypothetical protein [Kutzneria kofuensis]